MARPGLPQVFLQEFPAVQYLVYRYRKTDRSPVLLHRQPVTVQAIRDRRTASPPAGRCGTVTRSWHFDVDTSTWPPDEYLVVATSIQPRVTATARFCVAEPPAGYLQPALFAPAKDPVQPENQSYAGIGIDPVPDHYTGDRFAITGTTNLAAGDEILIVITPVSFGPTKGEVGEVGGTSGMATVLADGPAGTG